MTLDEVLRRGARPPLIVAPFKAPRLSAAARRVRERFPDPIMPPPDTDRDRLLHEIAERLRRWDWEGCTIGPIQQAIVACFDPKYASRVEFQDLREFFLDECRITSDPSLLRALMRAYIDGWSPDGASTRAIADVLRARRDDLPKRERALVDAAPELLDPTNGHKTLAARLLSVETPFAFARQLGFQAPHGPGFLAAAHGEFLRAISPRLGSGDLDGPARLLAWIAPPKAPPREDAVAAISALLAPWRSREPPEQLRRLLTAALVSAYGDPRVGSRGLWGQLPHEDRAVLMRWLVGATLEAFLDVVAQSVRGVDGGHMNRDREVFWRDMFRRGVIDEAWVALSDAGRRIAAERAKRLDDPSLNAHGRQIGRTKGDADRSLIIMRCGKKIVVDGSHNFMIHIFNAETHCELLYKDEYEADKIRKSREAIKRKHKGDWQSWVREQIL